MFKVSDAAQGGGAAAEAGRPTASTRPCKSAFNVAEGLPCRPAPTYPTPRSTSCGKKRHERRWPWRARTTLWSGSIAHGHAVADGSIKNALLRRHHAALQRPARRQGGGQGHRRRGHGTEPIRQPFSVSGRPDPDYAEMRAMKAGLLPKLLISAERAARARSACTATSCSRCTSRSPHSTMMPSYDVGRERRGITRLVGLENWSDRAAGTCGSFAGLYIVFALALGLGAGDPDRPARFAPRALLRSIFLYPMALSFIVTGTAWKWLLDPGVGLERSMHLIGWEQLFLQLDQGQRDGDLLRRHRCHVADQPAS